jgi:hypothetical protein
MMGNVTFFNEPWNTMWSFTIISRESGAKLWGCHVLPERIP